MAGATIWRLFDSKGDCGAMATNGALQREVENSPNDERGNKVTTIKCHGRLISETSGEMKELVKPLIPQGGRIVIDLGDLNYLDSSGLGALVGLKASAIKQGMCMLELVNMTPRIMELLRITNLMSLFSS
jgi:anti-anti-sigma factor